MPGLLSPVNAPEMPVSALLNPTPNTVASYRASDAARTAGDAPSMTTEMPWEAPNAVWVGTDIAWGGTDMRSKIVSRRVLRGFIRFRSKLRPPVAKRDRSVHVAVAQPRCFASDCLLWPWLSR